MEANLYAIFFLLSMTVLIYLVVMYVKADSQEIDEKDLRIAELEEKVERLNLEYNRVWDVLRATTPITDIELEYIGFKDVEDWEDG